MEDLRELFKDGVLPPYLGTSPRFAAQGSPYRISLKDLVSISAYSPERREILDGLLNFRARLKGKGLKGFQWIDGSFVEDIENSDRARPPSDIDLVTWVVIPDLPSQEEELDWYAGVEAWHRGLHAKETYHCDAYIEALYSPGIAPIQQVTYWNSLLSHSKEGDVWKGYFQIGLDEEETDARDLLSEVVR